MADHNVKGTHVNAGASHTRVDGSLVNRFECFTPTEQELAALPERLIPVDEFIRHNETVPIQDANPEPQHGRQDLTGQPRSRPALEAETKRLSGQLKQVEKELKTSAKPALPKRSAAATAAPAEG